MGTIQEAMAKLLRKKDEPKQEKPALRNANAAEKAVNKISDDDAPGVIQKRKKLYEDMEKATKE